MDLIEPISDLFKCVCSPICEYFDYYRKLDENMEELDRVLRELESKKKDIEATLSRAEREQGKKPSNEVSDWLKNVQRINTKAESFNQEVEKGNCFSRACLGKDVEKKIDVVMGDNGMTLSTTSNLVGERTGKIVEEIWEDLMGDKVSKIGVWGMGGIGKTTIMSHINNKLQEKPNKFNDVIWVTVSQPLDLIKLQTEIATALKESLPENEDKEAFNLFIDGVGTNILQVPALNKEIINEVVEECGCLPLAIVTVAASMSGEEEIYEWQNALNELRGRLRSLNDDVQAKYDRGHTILNRLVNCCLLESAKDGSCVKMHDLIRDMALRITSKSPLFMVTAGLRLLKFPGEQEWEENLERVSLMENDFEEIPSNMSPHCEILSTLLLQHNKYLQRIPECFFVHMHGLKVLNLCHTSIEVLPNSVSDLTNLRSLLLRWCGILKRVPSLAKLLALQYLDLEGTWIEEVPEDFGGEVLRETVEEAARLSDRLDTFVGYFSTLNDFNIYVKSTDGRGSKNYCLLLSASGKRGFLEVDKSVRLFACKICETEETIVLPEDVQYLEMFGVDDVASLNDVLPREQGLVNIGKFSHDLKVLRFLYCRNLKNLFSLRLLPALQNLEVLAVGYCFLIEEIVAVEDEETEKELATNTIINTVTLPRLKKLHLEDLREFKSICSDNGVLVCNSLQEIEVYNCPKLKRLSLSLPLLDNGQPSPPPALEVIEIKKELWESLEWDQPNAKDVLNPYCKFWRGN
ncbi:NB-ARC domain-containing protein [Citrus sinensis]|uniref:NB-ARC domain-containing protein n=1 Tax=Citrus sinensis TaxID=2711 RepID=A0ACB8JDV7_CITSI|nr:NB-ARC domain-containing protein [Citrus sinensis]